jgi:hypothetical protein
VKHLSLTILLNVYGNELNKNAIVNEYNLECPVDWEEVHSNFDWIATDWNGDVYAYEECPFLSRIWSAITFRCKFIKTIEPPNDYRLCVWRRPKIEK